MLKQKKIKFEKDIYNVIAKQLKSENNPSLIWRFDLGDRSGSHYNVDGYPDFHLELSKWKYKSLYLEIKLHVYGVQGYLNKKTHKLKQSSRIQTQSNFLTELNDQGHFATFAGELWQTEEIIRLYRTGYHKHMEDRYKLANYK